MECTIEQYQELVARHENEIAVLGRSDRLLWIQAIEKTNLINGY